MGFDEIPYQEDLQQNSAEVGEKSPDVMTFDYCQKLARSMPRRLAMVIANDGGSIKYLGAQILYIVRIC